MNDAPLQSGSAAPSAPGLPPDLARTVRFLRLLTGLLGGTMILGLIAIVALLVTRLPAPPAAPTPAGGIRLPDGVTPLAVTLGTGWALAVTGEDEIVVFDPMTGAVSQRVKMERPGPPPAFP
ncbi:MAG: DUF6476 family protein [Pseudomonadota bacterium]|jgi:hypothetical protein